MEGATTESRQIQGVGQGVGRDGSVGKCSKAETEADRGAALTLWVCMIRLDKIRRGQPTQNTAQVTS
ncbi:hypothetical protein N7527_000781 [Penicillium freii]|nr:hypothetical protein N7527_000781 [Penicillium freii]